MLQKRRSKLETISTLHVRAIQRSRVGSGKPHGKAQRVHAYRHGVKKLCALHSHMHEARLAHRHTWEFVTRPHAHTHTLQTCFVLFTSHTQASRQRVRHINRVAGAHTYTHVRTYTHTHTHEQSHNSTRRPYSEQDSGRRDTANEGGEA